VLARDAAQPEMAFVQVAHRWHERDPACPVKALRELGRRTEDFHAASGQAWPRLKNSRRARMPVIRASSIFMCDGLSTKFRRSLLMMSSGASSYW